SLDTTDFTTTAGAYWVLSLPGVADQYQAVLATAQLTGDALAALVNAQANFQAVYDDSAKRLIVIRTSGTFTSEPVLVETNPVTVTGTPAGDQASKTLDLDTALSNTSGKRWTLTLEKSGAPNAFSRTFEQFFDTDRDTTALALRDQINTAVPTNGLSATYASGDLVVSRTNLITTATLVADEIVRTAAVSTVTAVKLTVSGTVLEAETWTATLDDGAQVDISYETQPKARCTSTATTTPRSRRRPRSPRARWRARRRSTAPWTSTGR
ncbi:MAG: hypothetical protein HYS35_06760, partial [Betaproteobacteria bacterium]|nr:hypothetical protein [Betaproteobacteria bacterium]